MRNVSFVDTSAAEGTLSGTIVIDTPLDESGLTGYRVYFANETQRLGGEGLSVVTSRTWRLQVWRVTRFGNR